MERRTGDQWGIILDGEQGCSCSANIVILSNENESILKNPDALRTKKIRRK